VTFVSLPQRRGNYSR